MQVAGAQSLGHGMQDGKDDKDDAEGEEDKEDKDRDDMKEPKKPRKEVKKIVDEPLLAAFRYFDRTGAVRGCSQGAQARPPAGPSCLLICFAPHLHEALLQCALVPDRAEPAAATSDALLLLLRRGALQSGGPQAAAALPGPGPVLPHHQGAEHLCHRSAEVGAHLLSGAWLGAVLPEISRAAHTGSVKPSSRQWKGWRPHSVVD